MKFKKGHFGYALVVKCHRHQTIKKLKGVTQVPYEYDGLVTHSTRGSRLSETRTIRSIRSTACAPLLCTTFSDWRFSVGKTTASRSRDTSSVHVLHTGYYGCVRALTKKLLCVNPDTDRFTMSCATSASAGQCYIKGWHGQGYTKCEHEHETWT